MKTINEHQNQTDSLLRESVLLIEQVESGMIALNEQVIKSRELIADSYALMRESASKAQQK